MAYYFSIHEAFCFMRGRLLLLLLEIPSTKRLFVFVTPCDLIQYPLLEAETG